MAEGFPDTDQGRGGSIRESPWILFAAALAVSLVVGGQFLGHDYGLRRTLGDTDDAMRLVLVRDLLAGRGWYDQWVWRLQPPVGTWMHWSRLLDGALAGAIRVAGLFMPPNQAELFVRMAWPLAWILPAAAASLSIARNLAGRSGLIAGAVLLMLDPWAFVQFQPGRIDHHNVQIALTLAAAAFSVGREPTAWRGAAAGLATALALAIGIESLPFQAAIGCGVAAGLALDASRARFARAYGLALAGAALALFLTQTPPGRWPLSVCDALGLNLVVALVIAGLGLALASALRSRARLVGIAAAGALAAAVYLALDPACIGGPMAAVDPRLKPFWFGRVEELKPWFALIRDDRFAAIRVGSISVLSLAAAGVVLSRKAARTDVRVLTVAACAVVAVAATLQVLRQEDYAYAFGLPLIAVAVANLGSRFGVLAVIALCTVSAPTTLAQAAAFTAARLAPRPAMTRSPNDRCYDAEAYRALAALPPGLVLADINLGPFILAHTHDTALAAPYHRMAWGDLAAHDALGAQPDRAEAKVRALRVRYVVECGALIRVGPGSFEAALRRGPAPAWLSEVSRPGAVLRIYRVGP